MPDFVRCGRPSCRALLATAACEVACKELCGAPVPFESAPGGELARPLPITFGRTAAAGRIIAVSSTAEGTCRLLLVLVELRLWLPKRLLGSGSLSGSRVRSCVCSGVTPLLGVPPGEWRSLPTAGPTRRDVSIRAVLEYPACTAPHSPPATVLLLQARTVATAQKA